MLAALFSRGITSEISGSHLRIGLLSQLDAIVAAISITD